MRRSAIYYTIASIMAMLSVVPAVAGFLIMLRIFLKDKYYHALFLTLGKFFYIFTTVFWAISIVGIPVLGDSTATFFYLLGFYSIIPAVFFLVLLVDDITRESVDPIKTTGFGVLFTIMIFISFDPSSVVIAPYPNGDLGIFLGGMFRYVFLMCLIPISILLIYYGLKIYWATTRNIKKYALILLLGIVLWAFVPGILVAFAVPMQIPGIQLFIMAIGDFLTVLAIAAQPKIAFVLPFKALRLTVIETNSGISLFTYSWSKMDILDSYLFSGIMQAIGQILTETIKSGNVDEIHVENAILLINRSEEYPVACVLVATGATRSLRKALDSFAAQFFQEFGPHFKDPTRVDIFEEAASIVEDRFSFVPKYT